MRNDRSSFSVSDGSAPRELVDRQVQAYNERNIEAFCAFYAADAVLSNIGDGTELCRGSDAVRALYSNLFVNNPNLHCDIKGRMELESFVIDHERVTGISGKIIEALAIYEIHGALIQNVRFIQREIPTSP